METLPTELRQHVLSDLPLPSLKSIRLASRKWASLGAEKLLEPVFRTLPFRDDFSTLRDISQHEYFRRQIQKIEFCMGELNEYHARHNIYFVQYMRDPESRASTSLDTWAEFQCLKQKYETLEEHYCKLPLLASTLPELPALREISITLNTCPFSSELLQQIWKIPSTRLLPRVLTVERCNNILRSLDLCKNNVTTFTHDRLPFEFWGQNTAILDDIALSFRNLTDLDLICDYSSLPNNLGREECFAGLGRCLRAASRLRHLRLGFVGDAKVQVQLCDLVPPHAPWKNLDTLILEGIRFSASDLATFLLAHGQTLKRLRLGHYTVRRKGAQEVETDGVAFSEGKLKDIADKLQKAHASAGPLMLERFDLRGKIHGVQDTEVEEVYQGPGPLLYGSSTLPVTASRSTTGAWNCGQGAYDEAFQRWDFAGCQVRALIAKQSIKLVRGVERFILRGEAWPQVLSKSGDGSGSFHPELLLGMSPDEDDVFGFGMDVGAGIDGEEMTTATPGGGR